MIEYNGLDNPECYSKEDQQHLGKQHPQVTGPFTVSLPPVRYAGNGVSLTYKLPEPMTFDGVLQELVRLNLHTHNRIKSVTFELAEW